MGEEHAPSPELEQGEAAVVVEAGSVGTTVRCGPPDHTCSKSLLGEDLLALVVPRWFLEQGRAGVGQTLEYPERRCHVRGHCWAPTLCASEVVRCSCLRKSYCHERACETPQTQHVHARP